MKRAPWGWLTLAGLLIVAACDETPAAPPGGFRDTTEPGPDGEIPEPAECAAIAADFEDDLYDPLLSVACTFCHRVGGLAAGTDLVMVPRSEPDANARNVAALARVARKTIDGESVLLLRPTGRHPQGHPGGAPVDLDGPEYAALVDFVRAANVCRFEGPEGPGVCEPTGPRLLRRLTRDEWAQTIRDVLGVEADAAVLAHPGPHGFDTTPGFLRVNPSYQPIPLLRWAARIDPAGPWAGIVETSVKLAEDATPERFYPDWAAYSEVARRFVSDPINGGLGSYDAIRAYLWPALMVPDDPMRGRLLARGSRLLEVVRSKGFVPEKVDAFDPGKNTQLAAGPVGFQVVGQVFALALGDTAVAAALGEKVAAAQQVGPHGGLYGEPPFYYDHNLLLFAQGFIEGRFRFTLNGSLELGGARCASE